MPRARVTFVVAVATAALALCVCMAAAQIPDPSYDHQTTTYKATHGPYESSVTETATITPFFSPDTSIFVETELIMSATESIDIGTPGFSSWSNCTEFNAPLVGCRVSYVRSEEPFPIFTALLNAIHRGVKVRILTNDYGIRCQPGLIDPLNFLTVAGAETRLYTSTTFLHTKYIHVDGKKSAISSVNYSYTSFMKNREAGVILDGMNAQNSGGVQGAIDFVRSVYDDDWNQARPWSVNSYNATDMAIINDKTVVPLTPPVPETFSDNYVTSAVPITVNDGEIAVISNPDFAYANFTYDMSLAKETVDIYMYQITGNICNVVQDLVTRGVKVKLLVSHMIYEKSAYEAANVCYTTLYKLGVTVRKTNSNMYTYSHQKYYIRDGEVMWLSTGNFSPTDYPSGSNVFPPYSQDGWRDTNRDWTVMMTQSEVISVFQKTLDEDYERGYDWYP